MKVKTDYVPDDCNYLTVGKEYAAKYHDHDNPDLLEIQSDIGLDVLIRVSGCAHLDLYPWTVIGD